GGTGGGGTGGGGTGGGGTGGGALIPPTVDPQTPPVVTTNTNNPNLVVTGTGQPGDTVVITIGDKTQTTTIGPDGNWGTNFNGPNLPNDGTYTTDVKVTNPTTGGTTDLTGPTFVIDMTPPSFVVQDGTMAVGDIHNIATYIATNGATVISGQGEPGATMTVTANNVTQSTIVSPTGQWSVSFSQAQLPGGDYHEVPVTLTSTDIHGNVSAAFNGVIAIDTVRNVINYTSTGGSDNTVNLIESQNGFTVQGSSVAGAQLSVTIGGVTQPATAGSDGKWTASFGGGVVSTNGMATVSVSSTDAANNPNVQNFQFRVDTVATVGVNAVAENNIVNATENMSQIAVTGTSEIGTTSVVVAWGGQTITASVNPTTGAWAANFPANLFGQMQATNTTMVVTSIDAYGNTGTANHIVTIDTLASAAIGHVQMADNKINAIEAASGIQLSGTADPNSSIILSFEGQIYRAFADGTGNWSTTITLDNIGAVERDSTITVVATDSNGNVSAPVTHQVQIDTIAPNDPFVTGDLGNVNEFSGVMTQNAPGDYSYFAVATSGAVSPMTVTAVVGASGYQENGTVVPSELAVFNTQVPDGSYLVIRAVDAAGNESSTLYLRSTNEVTVDLSRAGLQGFDFGTIDLTSADANLTLDAARILALTGANKQMTITGDTDDVVHLQGGVDTQQTVTANGETYKLYTLGASGASVLIDDDIMVHPIV
ncbi:MAG: Ig-like domain-containing protein, partial [Paracoccaceae bacterium]|nr:Ig-like domain-containing protein [Paracoccaceae bacterium]